jgi:RNase P subunit RPR2
MTHLKGNTQLQKQFIKDRVSIMDKEKTYKVYRLVETLEGKKKYCPKCNSIYYHVKKSFGGATFNECNNCGYQTRYKYPKKKRDTQLDYISI